MEDLTPMMKQYHEIKRRFPGKMVFFRLGDFYEMFYEDAVVASRELEITLTARNKDKAGAPVPMCGVPYHSVDGYIARLLRKGYRIAICEQVEDPKQGSQLPGKFDFDRRRVRAGIHRSLDRRLRDYGIDRCRRVGQVA